MIGTIVLLILILALFGGGFYSTSDGLTPYRTGGWSIGGALIVVLVILLVMGRL